MRDTLPRQFTTYLWEVGAQSDVKQLLPQTFVDADVTRHGTGSMSARPGQAQSSMVLDKIKIHLHF